MWGEDYVKYLKGKHGFRSEIGEQGGDDCMEVDRGQQVAMPATVIEEEEDGTLGLVWSCFIHKIGGQLLHLWNWPCIALAFFLVPLGFVVVLRLLPSYL